MRSALSAWYRPRSRFFSPASSLLLLPPRRTSPRGAKAGPPRRSRAKAGLLSEAAPAGLGRVQTVGSEIQSVTFQGEQIASNRTRLVLQLCLIAAMTMAAYFPALNAGLIWDNVPSLKTILLLPPPEAPPR